MRAYLGARYRFDGLEMTSYELNRVLGERKAERSAREIVKSLTDLADLVKFARHLPPAFENDQALASAFRLVDITRPRPMAAPLATARSAQARS